MTVPILAVLVTILIAVPEIPSRNNSEERETLSAHSFREIAVHLGSLLTVVT